MAHGLLSAPKRVVTIAIFAIACPFTHAGEQPSDAVQTFSGAGKTWQYRVTHVEGWTVRIEKSLTEDANLINDLEAQLRGSFKRIKASVPPGKTAFLQTIKLWVSNESDYPLRVGEKGTIIFHPSKDWLREHGLNPEMENGVHIVNPRAELYEDRVFEEQPEVILHELSHAYHKLRVGHANRCILRAYEHAMAGNLYRNVPSREDPTKLVEAYAATNYQEYFAELTEAYFGENDWFPRNRQQLKAYDPEGYRMIETVWGVHNK